MKKFFRLLFVSLLTGSLLVSCGDDDDDASPILEPAVEIDGGTNIEGFRGETVTMEVMVNSNEVNSLTADGQSLNFTVGQPILVEFEIPEDEPDGTTFEVEFVASGTNVNQKVTATIELVPGPALENPDLEPLLTMFPGFENVQVSTLISTTDEINTYTSLGGFQLAGSSDGMGMVENQDGNFELLVNCEDDYSVVRLTLDQNLRPLRGDYLLNSSVSDFARQCSGTMWEKEIHGGSQDIFLSASESFHYVVKGIDPFTMEPDPGGNFGLPALGQFGWENAVPLPQSAFSGRTVIIGGDDDGGFFGGDAKGQISMYLSEDGNADFTGGKVYVLQMANGETATEADIAFGETVDVRFVEVTGSTVDEYDISSAENNAFQFMRVEDVDYGKGSVEANRIIYIAVTGRGPDRGTFNDWGTGYKLELDADNPLENAKLTQIISGNTNTNNMDGNMPLLQSPDNIAVTENFIYWQEDPNSFDRGHQAYIWQTDLDGNNPTEVLEIDLRQELNRDGDEFSGEFGALIDVSDKVGEDDVFLLALQPHYWEDESFEGLDGDIFSGPPCEGFCPREDDQGSQIVILRGLPR